MPKRGLSHEPRNYGPLDTASGDAAALDCGDAGCLSGRAMAAETLPGQPGTQLGLDRHSRRGATVLITRTSYSDYLDGAQFINFLLGPATGALAVPRARNLHHVRSSLKGISVALVADVCWLIRSSRR